MDRSEIVCVGVWMNFIPSPKTYFVDGGAMWLSVRSWKVVFCILGRN